MSVFRKTFFYYTSYLGWMVRILFLRDLDAICEEGNEGVLGSEVMEEEVMWWNVSLYQSGGLLGATEYFPLLKGTSRNGKSENANVLWRVMEVVSLNESHSR